MPNNLNYLGYADESHWNRGRFRSIALITIHESDYPLLVKNITGILISKNDTWNEIKWSRLNNYKDFCRACHIFNCIIDYIDRIRLDIIIWDINDSRHDVIDRSDELNLGRMYYKIIKDVLQNRWPDNSSWKIYIDEYSFNDNVTLKKCLDYVSKEFYEDYTLFEGEKIFLKTKYIISELGTVSSTREPLISIPDLFAGIGVFSREKYKEIAQMITKNESDQYVTLIDEIELNPCLSNSDKWRINLLQHFNEICKRNKLGVSLKTFGGLKTPNPKRPINFWWYKPQHEMDVAPRKNNIYLNLDKDHS